MFVSFLKTYCRCVVIEDCGKSPYIVDVDLGDFERRKVAAVVMNAIPLEIEMRGLMIELTHHFLY